MGSSYGFDFASLRNNRNSQNQSIVRLNTSDLRYTAGLGFDFYLRYVKFAIELKMTFSVMDLKIDNDDFYSQSIDGLNTRTFMLGFTSILFWPLSSSMITTASFVNMSLGRKVMVILLSCSV